MAKAFLRIASISCLAIWVAIWILFLLMRFSPIDLRAIPGIGIIMLGAIALAMTAPIVAAALAGAALIRRPRALPDLLIFGCSMAALLGQVCLFLITRWL
jgi:hypothetical protein